MEKRFRQSLEAVRFSGTLAECSAERLIRFLLEENDDAEYAARLAREAMRDARWALRIETD